MDRLRTINETIVKAPAWDKMLKRHDGGHICPLYFTTINMEVGFLVFEGDTVRIITSSASNHAYQWDTTLSALGVSIEKLIKLEQKKSLFHLIRSDSEAMLAIGVASKIDQKGLKTLYSLIPNGLSIDFREANLTIAAIQARNSLRKRAYAEACLQCPSQQAGNDPPNMDSMARLMALMLSMRS